MKEVRLDSQNVRFSPYSHLDSRGAVFEWEGRIFRAIPASVAGFYQDLLDRGVVEALQPRGLVPTKVSDLKLDSCPLVVEHERVPFWTVPTEWPFSMLRDATEFLCDFNLALLERGLATVDFCTRNVFFQGAKPTFVDFGSIAAVGEVSAEVWVEDVLKYGLNPLFLMSVRGGKLMPHARFIMHRSMCQVNVEDLFLLLRPGEWLRYLWMAERCLGARWALSIVRRTRRTRVAAKAAKVAGGLLPDPAARDALGDYCQRIKAVLSALPHPIAKSYWAEYYRYAHLPHTPSDEWTPKHRSVHRILNDLKPATVLDVGSNVGWFTKLTALAGSQVVALDVDELSVDRLYSDAKEKGLNILPLVMDFTVPWDSTPRHPSTEARIPCDMVMAMALIHHLVFGRYMHLDNIVSRLARLSKRWLLIEFIAPEDDAIKSWYASSSIPSYTLDNLLQALKRYFAKVETHESYAHRVLVLATKEG